MFPKIPAHVILNIFLIRSGFAGYWNNFSAATEATCVLNNVKLLSLMNLLCNTTQTTSIQTRDACYGCFFRAGSLKNGPTKLSSLNDCARLYLIQTDYETCAANLQALVDGNRLATTSDGYCYTGYCDFVRCVRRINAHQLIADCYAESLGTRELEEDLDRVFFYTNVTSCILARSRCSQYNPITGELQTQFLGSSFNGAIVKKPITAAGWIKGTTEISSFYFNSLQISATGDIRIISFPLTTSVSELFCAQLPSLQQSGFNTFNC